MKEKIILVNGANGKTREKFYLRADGNFDWARFNKRRLETIGTVSEEIVNYMLEREKPHEVVVEEREVD